MVDFKIAYKEGKALAAESDRAREEIDSVFKQLNDQLKEISDGKIKIERNFFDKKTYPPRPKILAHIPTAPRIIEYQAITAVNPKIPDSPVKKLAKWSIDKMGYPCKIIWDDKEQFCEDKEALELVLSELLRDPVVAETIYALENLTPEIEETEAAA